MVLKTFLALAITGLCFSSAIGQGEFEEGATLIENKQFDEAKVYFNNANSSNPNHPRVVYYLGRLAFAEEKWDDAIKLFEKSVELHANDAEVQRWLGHAYIEKLQRSSILKQKGLAGKAKERFMKSVELAPNDLESLEAMIEFYLEAPGIAGGSKEKGLEHIKRVQALDERRGHEFMAYYYKKSKDWKAAEAEYITLYEMEPGDPEPYFNIGRMYQDAKKYDASVSPFEKCLEIDANYMGALYQIGRSAVLSGRNTERGIECFQKYLTMQPTDGNPSLAWAHTRLGMLYEKKREFGLAKQEYELALSLEPEHKEANKALKRLKRR